MSNPLLTTWNSRNNSLNVSKPHKKEKFTLKPQECRENNQLPINNFMKKSIFQQLVEQVMSDDELNVIGADTEESSAAESETAETGSENEGAEKVTVTLTTDQVECLRNILNQIDGDEGEDDLETEFNDDEDVNEDEEDEEFDAFATEAVEAEEIGTPLVNQKKGNPCKPSAGCNKVAGKVTSMAKAGKADASVTDKVGNDGDEGTPLVNQKKGNPKKPSGGDNKVAGRASNVGSDLFA